MTLLAAINHFCLTLLWWGFTNRRPCPYHLMFSATCVLRGITVCRDTRQRRISSFPWRYSPSGFWGGADCTSQTEASKNSEPTVRDDDNIGTAGKGQGTTLPSLGNMHRMQRSIKDVPQSTLRRGSQNRQLRKNREVTDPYEHWYDPTDVQCLFGGHA